MAKKPSNEPEVVVVDPAPVEQVTEPATSVAGVAPSVPKAKPISFGDVGYRDRPIDPKDLEGDANTVMVQAIASFAGIEGDKGPTNEPFPVSRQRYAELKANSLVELVK